MESKGCTILVTPHLHERYLRFRPRTIYSERGGCPWVDQYGNQCSPLPALVNLKGRGPEQGRKTFPTLSELCALERQGATSARG